MNELEDDTECHLKSQNCMTKQGKGKLERLKVKNED